MAEKQITGQGTKLSGFVSEEENMPPRECHNCIFYKHDLCHHPIVMIDPEVPGENGKPKPVGDKFCCNFFQSPGRTLFFVVRHGETELNAGNRFRGWVDVALDKNGRKQAEQAAEFLRGKGIREVYCSDLERAVETAEIICKILGLNPPVHDFRLRPWNMGELAGQEKSEENKKQLEEYVDNSSWVIPEGESLDQFSDRVQAAIDFYVQEARDEGIKLLVTHTSDVIQVDRYCQNEKATKPPDMDDDLVKPGGVLKVTEKRSQLKSESVLGGKPAHAEYGAS